MKIISDEECWQWLESNLGNGFTRDSVDTQYPSLGIEQLLTRLQAEFAGCSVYELPISVSKRTVFAKDLSEFLVDASQPGLFWVTAWGIGPSVENMTLFDGYRKSLGESRPIHSAAGHIFSQLDLPALECLLDLTLYFQWDATLFTASGMVVVRISHDEWVSIHSKDVTHLKSFQTEFDHLGFLEWKSSRAAVAS